MPILLWILLATFLSGVLGLALGVLLLVREELTQRLSLPLISFAAGTLLGVAFLDLLPEALESSNRERDVFLFALIGLSCFFLMERFLLWFHHHHQELELSPPATWLIMTGDSLHNFLDGTVIAASFLVSVPLGIITTAGVFFHELPQEAGDFIVMLHGGMPGNRVLLFNFLSSLTSLGGALCGYFFLLVFQSTLPFFLALGAGMFIYIAGSDLIPEIHRGYERGRAVLQTALFFAGVLVMWSVGVVAG